MLICKTALAIMTEESSCVKENRRVRYDMSLLSEWTEKAYNENATKEELNALWNGEYFPKEKEIYSQILKKPDEVVKGTVKELAEKFDTSIFLMTGFLDGINESLKEKNPIETMDENTEVALCFDTGKLYKNMVKAGAEWLYTLPEWDAIFDEDTRKELYLEEKKSHTLRREGKKIGRNDPCPCGSGKKYKNCCMKKDQEAERQAIAALND